MRQTLKRYFIPHAENDYHPHLLHTKRVLFYGTYGVLVKCLVIMFAFLIPAEAFLLPDVLETEREQIIALTNELREKAFTEHPKLNVSAEMKAKDMAKQGYFAHENPNGRDLDYFVSKAGYAYDVAGENLAMGFGTAEEVVAAWKRSPTHYANLTDPEFEDIGVSLAEGKYKEQTTMYMAQHFGKLAAKATPKTATKKKHAATKKTALKSTIRWQDAKNGTLVSANVLLDQPVAKADLVVHGRSIPLQSDGSALSGSDVLPVTSDEMFRIYTLPEVIMQDRAGNTYASLLHWDEPKNVAPTPLQKYLVSKSVLGTFAALFFFERAIFTALFSVFCLAFILNLAFNYKKQRSKNMLQSGLLLILLAVLSMI